MTLTRRRSPKLILAAVHPLLHPIVVLSPALGGSTSGSVSFAVSGIDHVGDAHFVYVSIANKRHKRRKAAMNLTVALKFIGLEGNQLYEINARWSDPQESQLNAPTLAAPQLDVLPATGISRYFDVALKYPKDEICYAFNDQNRTHADDLRYRPINDRIALVRSEVTADHGITRAEFELKSNGEGSVPTLVLRQRRRSARHPIKGKFPKWP